jgi:hypothetical protein
MFSCLVVVSAFMTPLLHGQVEPRREDSKPLPAIRAWIFPGSETAEVSVSLSAGNDSEKNLLGKSSSGQTAADEAYTSVPDQQLVAEVRVGDRVESTAAVAFKSGHSYTMLVWNGGGKWQSKLYLDAGGTKSEGRELRVINFAEDRDSSVAIGDGKGQKLAASSVTGIPVEPKISMVNVEVPDPQGGPAAKSTVEIDFTVFQNAYVVIAPDYRGRMRPRVLPGGRTPESLKAEAALQTGPSEQQAR